LDRVEDAEALFSFRPREETVEDLLERALNMEEEGRLGEAADVYRRALAEEPLDPVLHFNLGNVHFAGRALEEAVASYDRAVALDETYAEAWNNLGNALGELKQWPQAIEAFRAALRHAPDYAEAHFNLAETLFAVGRVDKARTHWRACLDHNTSETIAASALERLRTLLKT
jgi:tetratricopeptide (TPR) repeat protein